MEDITDMDYKYARRICTFGEYHDLYVQSDTLLLANVFNNFRIKYLKIYGPANFFLHQDWHGKQRRSMSCYSSICKT